MALLPSLLPREKSPMAEERIAWSEPSPKSSPPAVYAQQSLPQNVDPTFVVFGQYQPLLKARYTEPQLALLMQMPRIDQQVFLAMELYDINDAQVVFKDNGVDIRYACYKHRHLCRSMGLWRSGDKRAMLLAMQQVEAEKFKHIADVMQQVYETHAWSVEHIKREWLVYKTAPTMYLAENSMY